MRRYSPKNKIIIYFSPKALGPGHPCLYLIKHINFASYSTSSNSKGFNIKNLNPVKMYNSLKAIDFKFLKIKKITPVFIC